MVLCRFVHSMVSYTLEFTASLDLELMYSSIRFLIDAIGRRKLLIGSTFFMGCVFAILSGVIKQIDEKSPHSYQYGIIATILCFLYMGAFTTGFQATG